MIRWISLKKEKPLQYSKEQLIRNELGRGGSTWRGRTLWASYCSGKAMRTVTAAVRALPQRHATDLDTTGERQPSWLSQVRPGRGSPPEAKGHSLRPPQATTHQPQALVGDTKGRLPVCRVELSSPLTSPWHSRSPVQWAHTTEMQGAGESHQWSLRNKDNKAISHAISCNLLPRNARAGGTSWGFFGRCFCDVE